MRHVRLEEVLTTVFAGAGRKDQQRLARAHKQAASRRGAKRQLYINTYGANKWSPLKSRMLAILGNKCWYTEVELVGAPLAVDHYRPTSVYWWLAFSPENFRVSCPFANSPKHNELYNRLGGKGATFPLLAPRTRAKRRCQLKAEKPVILDPCEPKDCALVAFQTDGRPVIHPDHAADAEAIQRVDESKILLNLDHPDFNSKREQLYHDIADDVETYEELAPGSASRTNIRRRMAKRISGKAPFSVAAEQYLQLYRHLEWVEDLLAA